MLCLEDVWRSAGRLTKGRRALFSLATPRSCECQVEMGGYNRLHTSRLLQGYVFINGTHISHERHFVTEEGNEREWQRWQCTLGGAGAAGNDMMQELVRMMDI
jgi:hypothetical protein